MNSRICFIRADAGGCLSLDFFRFSEDTVDVVFKRLKPYFVRRSNRICQVSASVLFYLHILFILVILVLSQRLKASTEGRRLPSASRIHGCNRDGRWVCSGSWASHRLFSADYEQQRTRQLASQTETEFDIRATASIRLLISRSASRSGTS